MKNFTNSGKIPVITGLMAFLILLPFGKIDFDRAHDGYILAGVIALNQGLEIHSQVSSQYGFIITTFLSFFTLGSDFPSLIVRIIHISAIATTVFLIANIGFLKNSTLKISKFNTLVCSIVWLFLNDVFSWIPIFPWTTNFINLSLFLILNLLLTYSNVENKKTIILKGIIIGFTIAALPFMRINVGLLASISFMIFIFIEHNKLRRKKDSRFLVIGLSILATWICFILFFYITDIYQEVIYQTVIWPLNWSGIASSWNNPIIGIGKILFTNAIFLIIFASIVLLILHFYRPRIGLLGKIQKNLYYVTLIIPPAYVLRFSMDGCWQFPCTIGGQVIFAEGKWPFDLISNFRLNLLYFIVAVSFLIILLYIFHTSIVLFYQVIFKKYFSFFEFWEVNKYKLLFAFIAISNFSQIYPVYDSRHVWWSSPTGIIALIVIFNKSEMNKKIVIPIFLVITSILIPSSLVSGYGYLNILRVPAPEKSIANGMLVVPGLRNVLQEDFDILDKIPTNATKLFYINESYHAVYNRKYNSIDEYFSTNGTESLKQRLSLEYDYLIIENYLINDNKNIIDSEINLKIFSRNDRITIFQNFKN